MITLKTYKNIWIDFKNNIIHYDKTNAKLVGNEDILSVDDIIILCFNLAKDGINTIGVNNHVDLQR